jgi:oxygen-dependent protoporphyrinogen oxidase
VAARLLSDLSPDAARELGAITHSSVALVTLVLRRDDLSEQALRTLAGASGFLVPRDADRLVTAASFGSTKWAHWDDGRHVVLRVSAGHAHDDRALALSDDQLVAGLRADLADVVGIDAAPVGMRVTRYPDGFAQYRVGHMERVERITAALERDAPGVLVAGSALHGVGIPASIRSGRDAARRLAV